MQFFVFIYLLFHSSFTYALFISAVWPRDRAKFHSECHYAIRVSNVIDYFAKRVVGGVKPVRCARNAKIRLVEIRGVVLMHRVQYFGGAFDVTTMFDTQRPKYRMP